MNNTTWNKNIIQCIWINKNTFFKETSSSSLTSRWFKCGKNVNIASAFKDIFNFILRMFSFTTRPVNLISESWYNFTYLVNFCTCNTSCLCFQVCYRKGFLSFTSYDYYSRKLSISFHLQLYLLRCRGLVEELFHLLCVAPDCSFYSLRFGSAFQLSRLIPRF